MNYQELKMQCLMIVSGDIDKAKTLFEWVIEQPPYKGIPIGTGGTERTFGRQNSDWMKGA